MPVLAAGAALFLLACLGFAASGGGAPLPAAAFVLAGEGMGCAETAEHAAVASLSPEPLSSEALEKLVVGGIS